MGYLRGEINGKRGDARQLIIIQFEHDQAIQNAVERVVRYLGDFIARKVNALGGQVIERIGIYDAQVVELHVHTVDGRELLGIRVRGLIEAGHHTERLV